MKSILNKIVLVEFLVLLARQGASQGFVNLDFEDAQIKDLTFSVIPATNAFPGWSVNAPYVSYDDVSLSGGSISIMDKNAPYYINTIQGMYFAFFQAGNEPSTSQTISLGQTGTIPLGTESITFWGNIGGLQITFAGQPLVFSETGSTANYNTYAADISSFAGQNGQLLFSEPAYTDTAMLDNIQFSSSPTPEPSTLCLAAFGGFILAWRRWTYIRRP